MFGNEDWLPELVAAANDDERFAEATRRFDGSVAFEIGSETRWLKVYRGEVIDTEPYVPAFGATFRFVGDETTWQRLARGDISLSEGLYEGTIRTEGNRLEATRMRDAVELLIRHLQDATEGSA